LTDTLNPTGYAQVLEELNGAYGVQRRCVYGLDLISQTDAIGSDGTQYYGYDGTGSTRLLTDETGAIAAVYDYDAFGTLIYTLNLDPGTLSNPHRFHGEYYDSGIDKYYLRARWMSTDIGRFWSMDRFKGDIAAPTTLHKYVFVYNNPANYNDSLGLFGIMDASLTIAVMSVFSYMPAVTKPQKDLVFPPLPAQFNMMDLGSPVEPLEVSKANVMLTLGEKSVPTWVSRVKPKGKWDYKYHWSELKGGKPGEKQYELCADFGNFNYGVTGSALGVPGRVLRLAGGADEILKDLLKLEISPESNQLDLYAFGDEWDDSMNIDIGINYWKITKIRNPGLR